MNSTYTNYTRTAPHTEEKENLSHIVVYVLVPLAVVLLCLTAVTIVLHFRRKRRRRSPGTTKREAEGKVEASVIGTEIYNEPDSYQNKTFLYENVCDNGEKESQYYNTKEDDINIDDKHNNNEQERRIQGIIEDDYGYGQFVNATQSGALNYSFVAEKEEMNPESNENTYENSEKDIQRSMTRSCDSNHNVYNTFHDSPKVNVVRRPETLEKQDSLYDHAVIKSYHSAVDSTYQDKESKQDTREDYLVENEYVNVEMKETCTNNETSSKSQRQSSEHTYNFNIKTAKVGGNLPCNPVLANTGSDLPENYINFNIAERQGNGRAERQHTVLDVTKDEIKCDGGEDEDNHEYFILEKVQF